MGGLSEDDRTIQALVRTLVAEQIAPRSHEFDRTHQFPRVNLELLGQQGYLGVAVPESLGGAGASYLAQTLVVEAIAYGCPATAVIYEVHNSLHLEAIWRYGTPEQQSAWLPRLLTGEWIGAFALTEPMAGSNAAAIRTVGRPVAGGYRLTGEKIFITSAGEADRYVVFGRIPGSRGVDGITAWVVARDQEGLSFGPPEAKMGLHASRTSSLRLDDAFVPTEQRLGPEGSGYQMALSLLDGGRIGIAAQGCGILAACLERSLRYAAGRQQFGQSIAQFEAIQIKLADMAVDLRAARLLTYDAARGREDPDIRERAAMAKLFSSERAVRHALAAIQIHGGYGYMVEYGVERLMRDAKVTEIYEGTSEILRILIASRALRHGPEWALEV